MVTAFCRAPQGLVFQWSYKGGAIVAAEATTGFVILHTGAGTWSAPCYLSSKSLSVGFTAGAYGVCQHVHSGAVAAPQRTQSCALDKPMHSTFLCVCGVWG